MSETKFKAFPFKIAASGPTSITHLLNTLKQIESDSLSKRMRNIAYSNIRVEKIKIKDDFWFLDFVKFRDVNGPGKASKGNPIEGFKFKNGETFCEEAALMIDIKNKIAVIQYNHYGVRYPAMELYLNSYMRQLGDSFSLDPIFEKNIDKQFKKRKSMQSLKVRIASHELSEQDKKNHKSLFSAVKSCDSSAQFIDISMSVGRSKNKNLGSTSRKIAEESLALSETNPEAVKRLEAKIIDSENSKQAVLNLIEQRISNTYTGLPVGDDKRWDWANRNFALSQSYKRWISNKQI